MKDLSPGTVVFGVFAILAGLLTAYGVRKAMEKPAPPAVVAPEPPEVKMFTIVVPKRNLPEYTTITAADVTEKSVPEAQFRQEYFDIYKKDPMETLLKGQGLALYRVTKKTIMSGTPIEKDALYAIGEVPTIGQRLKEGETALTLSMETLKANNGMVRPDVRVNILLTMDEKQVVSMKEAKGITTVTLMKNVRVLSTSYSRLPSEESTNEVSNVTFAVTPAQANKLTVAEKFGTLSLALCADENLNEELIDQPEDFMDIYSLLGVDRPAEPGPAVVELSAKKHIDNWVDGKRSGRTFDEWETLESINATRVAHGETPLTRVPRERTTIDNIPELYPRPSGADFGYKLVIDGRVVESPESAMLPKESASEAVAPTAEPSEGTESAPSEDEQPQKEDQAKKELPALETYGNLAPAI